MTSRCVDVQRDLSAFVDGLLDPEREAATRTHLAGCADCSGVVTDLKRIRAAAHKLGPIEPPEHLWIELAGQTRLPRRLTPAPVVTTRPARAIWQWAGLSAALLGITTALYLIDGAPGPDAPPGTARTETAAPAAPSGTVEAVAEELNLAIEHYERAIAELEAVAASSPSDLDAPVAASLARDRRAIDAAIAESRTALADAPENEPARASLFEALRRKISVLQATVALVTEMNQGDPAGAVKAAEGLGRES